MAEEQILTAPNIDDDDIVMADDASDGMNQDQVEETDDSNSRAMTMAFYDALTQKAREAMDKNAPVLYEQFMKDDNLIGTYGSKSVEQVNNIVDRMLAAKDLKIPDVDELLSEANRELDGFVAKYKDDINIDQKPNRFIHWFQGKKRKFDDFNFQRKTMLDKINVLEAKIIKKREDLVTSSYSIKELLDENAKSINGLIGVIASLESVHRYALAQAQKQKDKVDSIDKNSPTWQIEQTKLGRITDIVNAIEQQHSAYMARLSVAWITNSQVTNIIRTEATVVRNMNLVTSQTIPIMKNSIAQIAAIIKLKDANKANESIKGVTEHSLKQLQSLNENALPEIERNAQSPIISAETIKSATESQLRSNQKIIDAIVEGQKARAALNQAVLESGEKIKESDELRDKKLLNAVLDGRKETKRVTESISNEASKAFTGTTDGANQ